MVAALLLLGMGVAGPAAEPLRVEASSFLRANADSPVDWQRWDAAVLRRAKEEGRPVYVFIGSFLSELSRATSRQTFAHADTAAFLNKNFLCVIVDREEQPDVAALVQYYLREVKQQSGWPAHLWLTPELRPYEGAAYLPPTEEWGKSSFMKVAQQAQAAWASDPKGCGIRAAEAVATLAAHLPSGNPAVVPAEKLKSRLSAAADAWRAQFDATHGGFSESPKNPEPELLRFLLRQSAADRAAALTTLRAIATSALRDPLDGGFFRYATDAAWHIPYQQKALADQARLALAFLEAAQGDEAKPLAAAARGALDYALSRLGRADGAFAAAEDATTDEFTGYYVWTAAEIDAALGPDAAAFKRAHGVESAGNVSPDDDLSGRFKEKNILRSPESMDASLTASAARLLAVRARRPAPTLEDRAPAEAHGLLLAALSRAGAQLNEARYRDAAARLFAALKKDFILPADGLRHQAGSAVAGAPADYAGMALGCREFARAVSRPEADELATRLLAKAGQVFFVTSSGHYYATAAELPVGIFVRTPAVSDAPAAEALAILAGAPPEQARAMAAFLSASLEESGGTAPGDTLLALSLFPSN